MAKTDSEVLHETLQRVIRTETRLVTLSSKLGHEIGAPEDITVDRDGCMVFITSVDVPLSAIMKAARRMGLFDILVHITFEGRHIGSLRV